MGYLYMQQVGVSAGMSYQNELRKFRNYWKLTIYECLGYRC